MLITKFIIFIMHVRGLRITLNMATAVSNIVITQGLSSQSLHP